MEGLKKRVIALGIVFALLGAAFIAMSGNRPNRTESWVEQHVPKQFGDWSMLPGNEGPEVTYKMNEATYKELNAYGIVARVMVNARLAQSFDSVVIMSSRKESFHDPRVCFTAQGLVLSNEEVIEVPTKTHGTIRVTLATMLETGTRTTRIAAFFYRGPYGFAATTNELKWQMFRYQLATFQNAEGVFYRIMPMHPSRDPSDPKSLVGDLKAYIDEFLTALDKSSNGVL